MKNNIKILSKNGANFKRINLEKAKARCANSRLGKVVVLRPADTLWLNKVLFTASTLVVKIATYAKPQNVMSNE